MIGFISKLFGSGIVGSVERIASEFIETDMESAEAKSLFIKTLDPNGLMRRELSRFACKAYGFYLVSTTILVFIHAFSTGATPEPDVITIASQTKEAIDAMTELFLPITASWASIVGASFGVNMTNSIKEK